MRAAYDALDEETKADVKDQTFVNTTKVFPNPARDHIQIYSEERIDAIHILDMIGKLVYISPHPEPYVNIGDLKSGMYHLQLTSSGKNYTIPLFKL